MIDLTTIIEAILALAAALITAFVIPWIKSKITAEQLATMEAVTKTLVYAAEQIYGAGEGEKKLDYVVEQLEKRGYTVDRAAIEAAVKQYLPKSEYVPPDEQ